MPTPAAYQTGRTSQVGLAKQTAKGTYAAPTDILQATSFTTMDDPAPVFYQVLAGQLDSETAERQGVHDVGASLSAPSWTTQGMQLWKAAIGKDVLVATMLAAPTAPVPTTNSSGGTIAAGVYQVEVTYVNAAGETVASGSGSITTTGSTSTITVPSPSPETGATGWYAYVTQAGGNTYYRQQTAGSPTAIGTNLTLTAPPTITGANPPVSNTAAYQTAWGNVDTAGCLAGAQSIPISSSGASIPAVPTGLGEWTDCWITIGTGGTQEDVLCLGISGQNLLCSPTQYAHVSGEAVVAGIQHAFIPLVASDSGGVAALDWLSFCFQQGAMFERQLQDCRVASVNLKGTDQQYSTDYSIVSDALVHAETATLTSLVAGTGEAGDLPMIVQDLGGLFLRYAAGQAAAPLHPALTQFDYKLQYAVQKTKTSGTLAQLNILGARTQTCTFTELSGDYDATPDIHTNFVATGAATEAFLGYKNRVNGNCFSLWMPKVYVTKYDPVGPTDKPLEYSGELHPVYDNVSAKAVKVVVKNNVTKQY